MRGNAYIFDADDNTPIMICEDVDLNDPAYNDANMIQVRSGAVMFSAINLSTLVALSDHINPEGKSLREIKAADAAQAAAELRTGDLDAMRIEANAKLDAMAEAKPEVVSELAQLHRDAEEAIAKLNYAIAVAKGEKPAPDRG